MLDFFRRHQRYFFSIITVVIIISFSFFGTYSTLSDGSFREQIAFRSINGKDITRHQLDEMAAFIGTDAQDKFLFGGIWGPNFLNDGVVSKDFLETGLGAMLASSYQSDIMPDLAARLEKERRYELYAHPQAGFITTEAAWNYLSPSMSTYYNALRASQDPTTPQALQARAALFLMEKQFPQQLLKQVLRYQEKQYAWVVPDRELDRADLSLFGYHTLEDWFGPRFVRLVSEFIINSAAIAESKGYEVTKADALSDLIKNSEMSYQQNARSQHLGVASSKEYFNEQLRRLGMDQNGAANVWRQVMLFRRLFQDMGSSVFIDPLTYHTIDAYALETVEGELYRLPKELHLNNFAALQKFETYLDAVAKRTDEDKAKLTLPTTYLTAEQVAKTTPELVQKDYVLEIAQVSKKTLEGDVTVKDTWNWEVDDKGWEQLKKQFPELGVKKGATRDERFAALDSLDNKTRGRVDAFARNAIVNAHPEWLDNALKSSEVMRVPVGIREKGGNTLISGLDDGKSLMKLLDAAPIEGKETTPAAKDAGAKLSKYSADDAVYYKIAVIERNGTPRVLTFVEADQQGILTQLLDKQLEAYYVKTRDSNTKDYQNESGAWKPLADVKDSVAARYFDKTLSAIKASYAKLIAPEKAPDQMIPDYAATLRFFPYANELKAKLQKDPQQAAQYIVEAPAIENGRTRPVRTLADQWKFEHGVYQTTRSSATSAIDAAQALKMSKGEWSKVNAPANGDITFFRLSDKKDGALEQLVSGSVAKAKYLLSNDAQQKLMRHVLITLREKNAISLDYLNQIAEADPIAVTPDDEANL